MFKLTAIVKFNLGFGKTLEKKVYNVTKKRDIIRQACGTVLTEADIIEIRKIK